MKHYHYIFAGAGLASLMTAYKMALRSEFSGASILMLDADTKKTNDRTWCFWQEGIGNWDKILFKKWETALFAGDNVRTDLDMGRYRYKMVRGIDFYDLVFAELVKHPNIEFTNSRVIGFNDLGDRVSVRTDQENYTCAKLFNSIYDPSLPASQNKYPVLQQHFIGWHVKTEKAVFDPVKPTFMDFSIPQKGNTRFMYILPFSETEAIVEYTLFSGQLLPQAEYEEAIAAYLHDLGAGNYTIADTEKGSIPMTSYHFWGNNTKNILNIGSAGGWTKASTGYTFRNADKKSGALVDFLLSGNPDLRKFHRANRFWYYDLLLLDILAKQNYKGNEIFSAMFRSGKAAAVFRFLDEETTFMEDLRVISRCPKGLFIKALLKRLF